MKKECVKKNNYKTFNLNPDEIWPLLNILNEICHGIKINNFEKTIGAKKDSVVKLLDKITEIENEQCCFLKLNDFELKILENSFSEVFKQIDLWEFQTRIGVSLDEAKKIKEILNN
ncbi:MAG TPA: hypothetical protein VKR53_03175 [Puia sp.]|nr:hypothetical protein [Puia sp.]